MLLVNSATQGLIRRKTFSKVICNRYSSFHTNIQSLEQTKQAHALALTQGLLPRNVPLCASLLLRYATYGDPTSAISLFQLTQPFCLSPFLPNTLIRACSIATSHYHVCFETYNAMFRSGVFRPDHHTLPFILKACADCSEIEKGMEVHGFSFKSGWDSCLFVGNTLMLFYGGFGDLRAVNKVFDEMTDRDVISWNTIIGSFSGSEALTLFKEMNLSSGLLPNTATIVTVLPICALLGDEFMTREIQCYAIKVGLYCQITICNALVDAYGKCGYLKGMMRVFREIDGNNQVSYNAIITCLAYTNNFEDALDMFREMIHFRLRPNFTTVSSMTPVLVELECFLAGKELHGYSLRSGMVSDIFVSNSFVDMYSKFGCQNKASAVFHSINNKNVVSWNTMMANLAQNGLELEAIGLVRRVQSYGEVPNSITFTNILPACAKIGLLNVGKEIHAYTIRNGAAFDLFVSNALIDMYAKCRCLKLAQAVFDISLRDEISYTTLIMGYSQTSDNLNKSLDLFSEMRMMGMTHDTVAYVGVLSASANQGAIKQGREVHGFLVRNLFHSHIYIANSLIDLYSKCGKIELAKRIFDRITNKDIASWNTIILGYGMLGQTNTAITLFDEMKKEGVLECDSISYIAILSACSHGGLVEEGKRYFAEMREKNIKPTMTHYACMVDLLGRAGLIEEATKLITGLDFRPDSNIWGAMLGACQTYGDIERGCWAAEHLMELNPEHSGYYALLSNMYAQAGRWEDAHRVREFMKFRDVDKTPGRSWL